MVPTVFDEIQKQTNYYENKDPYNLSNRSNRTLENATVHYLGPLTYIVGDAVVNKAEQLHP